MKGRERRPGAAAGAAPQTAPQSAPAGKGQAAFRRQVGLILSELKAALEAVDPLEVERFVDALLRAEKVFFVGVGRVLLSLQALVKRLNHLGIRAWCLGDLGEPAITSRDLLVAGSGSGESVVPVAVARIARKHGARVAHIGSNPESSLAPYTDLFVRIPVKTRLARPGEIPSRQIMTSLFEQALYLFGDAVALMVMERKGLTDLDSLWERHANLE
jgi:6-phospho-3-hexuloisomerase